MFGLFPQGSVAVVWLVTAHAEVSTPNRPNKGMVSALKMCEKSGSVILH